MKRDKVTQEEAQVLAMSPFRDALLWVFERLDDLQQEQFRQFVSHPMIPPGEHYHARIDASQLVVMQSRAQACSELRRKILEAIKVEIEFERKRRQVQEQQGVRS